MIRIATEGLEIRGSGLTLRFKLSQSVLNAYLGRLTQPVNEQYAVQMVRFVLHNA